MTKERKEQYKTLAVFAIGFLLISWRIHSRYLAIAIGVISLGGLISPYLLGRITKAWMWIGEKIGAVMSRVILTVVFFVFLTPIALAFRVFSKKKSENGLSYFIERNHTYTAQDMEQTF